MSRNAPDSHFHVFTFSESGIFSLYNGENHFQIRELVAELRVIEYVVRHMSLLRKLAVDIEYFYVNSFVWSSKSCYYDHKKQESVFFPCYRLKINDF